MQTDLFRRARRIGAAVAMVMAAPVAQAQGFAAYVSPPRVVEQATSGQPLRQVVEIQHVGRQKGHYRVYTNDWLLRPDQSVVFSDELASDSCRPWVAIERRELTLEPGARYRYRFEVTPPAGTSARECRFALMVEGVEAARVQGAVNFPVGGRIGVIVYVAVGGAAPVLALAGTRVSGVNGKPAPVLMVRNSGTAHGRLEGFVTAVDADGKRIELAPADLPILPGETRLVALMPVLEAGQPAPEMRYPLQVKGTLEWGKSKLTLDASFAP
jgi:hypothetical protein